MSEAAFDIYVQFLQHLVLALLTLGAILALARVARHRSKERPARVPVERSPIRHSRDTDFRRPVSTGIDTRYPTRGPPVHRQLPQPDDRPDRDDENVQ